MNKKIFAVSALAVVALVTGVVVYMSRLNADGGGTVGEVTSTAEDQTLGGVLETRPVSHPNNDTVNGVAGGWVTATIPTGSYFALISNTAGSKFYYQGHTLYVDYAEVETPGTASSS